MGRKVVDEFNLFGVHLPSLLRLQPASLPVE